MQLYSINILDLEFHFEFLPYFIMLRTTRVTPATHPIVITIPSAVRYWSRRLKKNKSALKPYESAWFESQATRVGLYQRTHVCFAKKKAQNI